MVAFLISAGARLDIPGAAGLTPLHWAAGWGNLETARILVEAGAPRSAKDHFGKRPAELALKHAKNDIALYLESTGQDRPLGLQYTIGPRDLQTLYELTNYHELARSRYYHNFWIVYWTAVMIIATVVSYRAEEQFFACLFLASLGSYLCWSLPKARTYRTSIIPSLARRSGRQVQLEITTEGLRETGEGITSWVPWSSAVGFIVFRNTLIIQLKGNLCAIVPKDSIGSSSTVSFDYLRALLKEKGIREVPDPTQ